jgi:hypothetical protein
MAPAWSADSFQLLDWAREPRRLEIAEVDLIPAGHIASLCQTEQTFGSHAQPLDHSGRSNDVLGDDARISQRPVQAKCPAPDTLVD